MSNEEIPLRRIDADAQTVIRRLVDRGYESYLVGGCVRDLLLGRTPKDIDIATSATPSDIRAVFRNCRIIGRRFRLAHLMFGSKIIEVATFRKNPTDALETDGDDDQDLLIQQDNVFGTAKEDAWRRDFTVNGLFYDIPGGRVIDYVRGKRDLAARQLRTIGDPNIRFREDPVRMLRAVRLAARLEFDIEDQTYHALLEHKDEILHCPSARVLEEVYRFFRQGSSYESLVLLAETGLLALLLPDLDRQLASEPTLLDPFLQQLDAWVSDGEPIEISTILFLLGLPTWLPSLQPDSASWSLEQRHERIQAGLRQLQSTLVFPQKDRKRLELFLLYVPFPRRSRPRFFGVHGKEPWFHQLRSLCDKIDGFSSQLSQEQKSSGKRRRRRKASPDATQDSADGEA